MCDAVVKHHIQKWLVLDAALNIRFPTLGPLMDLLILSLCPFHFLSDFCEQRPLGPQKNPQKQKQKTSMNQSQSAWRTVR